MRVIAFFQYEQFKCANYEPLTKVLFVAYMFVMPIMMINILIAMMGNTYVTIITQAEKAWRQQVKFAYFYSVTQIGHYNFRHVSCSPRQLSPRCQKTITFATFVSIYRVINNLLTYLKSSTKIEFKSIPVARQLIRQPPSPNFFRKKIIKKYFIFNFLAQKY